MERIKLLNTFFRECTGKGAKSGGLEKYRKTDKKRKWAKVDFNLCERQLVVLDIETTGLRPQDGHEVISVGACIIRDKKIEPVYFNRLVKSIKPIPPFITVLTGITDQMVAEADDFCTVMYDLLDFIGDSVIIGHAIDFDINFLNYKLKPFCVRINNLLIDTINLSRALNPQIKIHTLDSILAYTGINPEGRHTSLGDALLTAGVFINFLSQLEEKRILTLSDLKCYIYSSMLYKY